jgi:phosphate transport system substrate-binding protein
MRVRQCCTTSITAILTFSSLALALGCHSKPGGNSEEAINLSGAGSTFVNPIMSRWTAAYQKLHSSIFINYQFVGSGAGIQQVKNGLVDFGASDAAIGDGQLKTMLAVIQIRESAGPVCITCNLPQVQNLKLTPEALSVIYLGTIKNWRDPAINKANPAATLPDTPIAVVHRSDGNGTTDIFSTYLSAVSPPWQQKVGKGISISWPVGLGGKGSEGVTGVVKQTTGAIGYVELSYAVENKLPVASLRNRAGEWVQPTPAATTAAVNASAGELIKDVRTPIVDPPASTSDAYPISGLTFLLIAKDGPDRIKRQALKSFVQYIISNGQDIAPTLNYSQLPPSVVQLDQKLIGAMTAGGQPLP